MNYKVFALVEIFGTDLMVQGVSEKTLFKDFYTPGPRDRMMSVVTILLSIVLVKVVGEMLDDD